MSTKNITKDIVLVALMAAVLFASKQALAFLPNVEAVTFLIILFTAVFGFKRGFAAVLIFVLIDNLLWGFGYYSVSHFIQFPGIAALTALVSRKGIKNEYVYTAVAFVMVVFFGIHSTLLDCAVLGGPFWARYAAGFLFYAAEILSACLLTLFAFKPLYKVLKAQADRFYGTKEKNKADIPAADKNNA